MNTRKINSSELPSKIMTQKKFFQTSSTRRREVWLECYKHYQSYLDKSSNPYLANLFIPKTQEAVEYLSAFFAGANQTITAGPEEGKSVVKAKIVGKLLEFQWRKKLKGRRKVIRWIKQNLLFGNGIMKVGWDDEKNCPWMNIINITDIFFDYYIADIQDSPIIHQVIKFKDDIIADDKYNSEIANQLIEGEEDDDATDTTLSSYDKSPTSKAQPDNPNPRCVLFEYWSNDGELITIGRTVNNYQILRRVDSSYKDTDGEYYKPFVKIRCKDAVLSNRAYDTGAIEPTLKIQKAFNDAVNEFFDNVSLVNNKQWIKRRGASINSNDLIRKPGGIITVDDINTDLKSEDVSDVKASILEMINFLDNEFQQASMVVNLMKGVAGASTATEAVMGQQNVFNLFDSVNQNIQEGMSELGQMLVELNLAHLTTLSSLQVLDDEEQIAFAEIDKKTIAGKYDIEIIADRKINQNQALRQKQLLEFLAIVAADADTIQQYPHLAQKIYKKWLEEAGFADADWFFDEDEKLEENVPVDETEEAKEIENISTPTITPGSVKSIGALPGSMVADANKPPLI